MDGVTGDLIMKYHILYMICSGSYYIYRNGFIWMNYLHFIHPYLAYAVLYQEHKDFWVRGGGGGNVVVKMNKYNCYRYSKLQSITNHQRHLNPFL